MRDHGGRAGGKKSLEMKKMSRLGGLRLKPGLLGGLCAEIKASRCPPSHPST